MKQACRIVREKFAATASLAALETLVHLNPAMRFNYLLFTIEI